MPFLILTLSFVLIRSLCSEEMSSWNITKTVASSKKALKCIPHFWWLISPKSVVMSSCFFFFMGYVSKDGSYQGKSEPACCLANTGLSSWAAGLSSPSGHYWMRQSLSLASISLSFRHARLPLSFRGSWELLHLFHFVFFLSLFFWLISTILPSGIWPSHWSDE